MITAKDRLAKMLNSGSIPHALLLVGCKPEEAYAFASDAISKQRPEASKKLASKTHPDVHFFYPEGRTGMHGIEGMRRLSQEVSFLTVEAPYKFLIVHDAERCLPTSSNALLKTLEEPVSHSIILLLTHKPERMLPTILSRCQTLYFGNPTSQLNVHQNRLLTMLSTNICREGITEITKALDLERKEWEKKMIADLPKDLSTLQRARLEKEIEGASTLEYQTSALSLLETFLLWQRDVFLLQQNMPKEHILHQDFLPQLSKSTCHPLSEIEKMTAQMRIAIERSTSLQTCLEALFMKFGYI